MKFINFYMMLVFLTTNLITSVSTLRSSNLQKFIDHHIKDNNLLILHSNKQQILTQKQGEGQRQVQLYIYNSALYLQVCYSDAHVEQLNILPQLLIKRSYTPIYPKPIPKEQQSSIKCYQIFNKIQLIEQPSLISPVQQQKYQSNQNEADKSPKKYKKELKYLINQYQLTFWVYRLGSKINQLLGKNNLKYKGTNKKLSLNVLQQFSLLVSLRVSNQTGTDYQLKSIWMSDATIKNNQLKISKKLSGKGLHQKVKYNLLTNERKNRVDINSQQCFVQIRQVLPHTTYIDVDELKGFGIEIFLIDEKDGQNQYENWDALYGDGKSYINIEKPAYESRQYQYVLNIPFGLWVHTQIQNYQFEIPIHFRYPNPYINLDMSKIKGSATKTSSNAQLNKSRKKRSQQNFIQFVQVDLYPTYKTRVVCNENSISQGNQKARKNKYQVEQDYLQNRGTALIPVGDAALKSSVNFLTLGSQVVCAVLLVKMLQK